MVIAIFRFLCLCRP